MYNKDRLRKAIRNLDADAIRTELRRSNADKNTAQSLLVEVVRSGCLIQRRSDPQRESKKVSLLGVVESYILQNGRQSTIAALKKHVEYAHLIERSFHAILNRLNRETVGVAEPDMLIWESFNELSDVLQNLDNAVAQHKNAALSHNNLAILAKVKTEDGIDVDPDDTIHELATSVRNTLLMLAHTFDWFDSTGLVVLPSRPLERIESEIGARVRYLATVWELVEIAEERIRFFEAALQVQTTSDLQPNTTTEVISLKYDPFPDLFEYIARRRQHQFLLEAAMEFTRISEQDRYPLEYAVALPPEGYISDRERFGLLMLEENRSYPAFGHEEFGGLTLREWLRGYFVLNSFAHEALQSSPFRALADFDPAVFRRALQASGLDDRKASIFLNEVMFRKGKRDLHDAPVLKDVEGHYYIVAGIASQTLPWEAVTSQLASIKERVEHLGSQHEARALSIFDTEGIPAKHFRYKLRGVPYDCDLAVLWDRHLFIFECKNYGLPAGTVQDSYHFWKKMIEAGGQASRVASDLGKNPQIVKRHFGAEAEWDHIHACVLNAVPFSLPFKLAGSYLYDIRALAKFFDEDGIGLRIIKKNASGSSLGMQMRGTHLWTGNKPTPSDLLRQMERPLQVQLAQYEFELSRRTCLLDEQLFYSTVIWERNALPPAEMLARIGIGTEDAEEMTRIFEETNHMLGAITIDD